MLGQEFGAAVVITVSEGNDVQGGSADSYNKTRIQNLIGPFAVLRCVLAKRMD